MGVIDSGGPADDPPGERAMARAFLADGAVPPGRAGPAGPWHRRRRDHPPRRPRRGDRHTQVFGDRPLTSALRVAAALRWFAAMAPDQRPEVICLSLSALPPTARRWSAPVRLLTDAGAVLVARIRPAARLLSAAYPARHRRHWRYALRLGRHPQLGPALFGAWCNSPEHGATGMGGCQPAPRIAGHLAAITAAGERRPAPPPSLR